MAQKKQITYNIASLIIKIFFISVVIKMGFGCANPGGITGGPKDTLAPKPRIKYPPEKATNFKDNKIIIEFDEWVQANNMQKELLITPKPKGNYIVKENKKRITLTFEEGFDENTTYTFNFRKGITDITEKNPADSSKIIFSTGAFIDSLQISGLVMDLKKNQPIANATVGLYRVADTIEIAKRPPYYLSKSNEAGIFKLENLKQDLYRLYVFDDLNENSLYNAEQEKVGFLTDSIFLDKNIDSLKIFIAREDHQKARITRARPSNLYDTYILELNEGIEYFRIEPPYQDKIAYFIENTGKSIKLYNLEKLSDSLDLQMVFRDSSANESKESRKIKFDKAKNKNEKAEFLIEPSSGKDVESLDSYTLRANKPIRKIDFEKIYFISDKDTLGRLYLKAEEGAWTDSSFSAWRFKKKIDFKEKLTFRMDSLALLNVEEDASAPLLAEYKAKLPNKYGTLFLTVESKEPSYVVELLNDKFEVVRTFQNPDKVTISFLPAGKYRLRAIIDENKDGKWTQGDFRIHKQAEKIILMEGEIPLRENWELRQTFKF